MATVTVSVEVPVASTPSGVRMSISFITADLASVAVMMAFNIDERVSFASSNKMMLMVLGLDSQGSETPAIYIKPC